MSLSLSIFTCSFCASRLSFLVFPRLVIALTHSTDHVKDWPSFLNSRMEGRVARTDMAERERMKVKCFSLGLRTRKVMLKRPLSFSLSLHLNCIQKRERREEKRGERRGGKGRRNPVLVVLLIASATTEGERTSE